MKMLSLFQDEIVKSGNKKIVVTVPSLIYNYLKVARKVQKGQEECPLMEIYKRVGSLINLLQELEPKQFIRLNLELVLSINQNKGGSADLIDEMVYELVSESLLTVQSTDQQEKQEYLAMFITTLSQLTCLSQDNYDTLATNVSQACGQLLKKHDQCTTVVKSLHLYFNTHQNNAQKVNEIFKKCFKLAHLEVTKSVANMGLFIGIMLEIITLETKSFLVLIPSRLPRSRVSSSRPSSTPSPPARKTSPTSESFPSGTRSRSTWRPRNRPERRPMPVYSSDNTLSKYES